MLRGFGYLHSLRFSSYSSVRSTFISVDFILIYLETLERTLCLEVLYCKISEMTLWLKETSLWA